MTAPNGLEGFRDFIRSLGYEPPTHIEPGRWMPFSTSGKPGDTAGRARLFPDCEGGVVYDWRSGECQTWQARRERPRSESELRAWREKCEKSKQEALAEREREAKQTAERAQGIWSVAKPAEDSHPYLAVKGIRSYGLRVYRGPLALRAMKCDGALIVPWRSAAGEVVSLQFIRAPGADDKRYLNGPKPSGSYFSIGKPEGTLCISEGYATGASIHAATGFAVAVAFDAGNLESTARALRGKFPGLRLIVCADDDIGTPGNPGLTKGAAAAKAAGALLAVPDFGDDRPAGATDFNDLANYRGGEAVQRCVLRATPAEGEQARPDAPRVAVAAPVGVELIRADTIKPEAVSWLWDGFLAAGKLHVMAGAPGTGKTTLALAFAATVTSAGRWPDGSRSGKGDVLIWSGEDSIADTLVPRLIAAGADCTRIHFVGGVSEQHGRRPFDPAADFPILTVAANRLPDLRLVIVDPIVSAIAGDSHKNAEVRRGLQPLVDFAESTRCAVLGISHFSKGTAGREVVERVTGSLAFGALARIVLATAKEPEEDEGGGRLLVRAKSNLGPDGGGFRYDLRNAPVTGGVEGLTASRVEWGGTVEGGAREILAAVEAQGDPEERSASSEAAEVLREILAAGTVQTKEARRKLKAEGFTEKQIRRARESLGVVRSRDGFGGTDFWRLPDTPHSCPVPAVPAHPFCEGTNGHERASERMNGGECEVL